MAEGAEDTGATVGLHTYRLPFHLWAEKYESGVVLRTTGVQQVPAACWPAAEVPEPDALFFGGPRSGAGGIGCAGGVR